MFCTAFSISGLTGLNEQKGSTYLLLLVLNKTTGQGYDITVCFVEHAGMKLFNITACLIVR